MIKKFCLIATIVVIVFAVASCSSGAQTVVSDMGTLDTSLAGCKAIQVTYDNVGRWVLVVRCSAMDTVSTAYPVGKTIQNTVIVSDPIETENRQAQIDDIMKQIDALKKQVEKLK